MEILKLYPAYKNYIWGGEKLAQRYGKTADFTPVAESWELSFHKDGETHLSDGRTLREALTPAELGVWVCEMREAFAAITPIPPVLMCESLHGILGNGEMIKHYNKQRIRAPYLCNGTPYALNIFFFDASEQIYDGATVDLFVIWLL